MPGQTVASSAEKTPEIVQLLSQNIPVIKGRRGFTIITANAEPKMIFE